MSYPLLFYGLSEDHSESMRSFFAIVTFPRILRILASFFIAILAGITLFWYPSTWSGQEIAHALRDAFIVAGIIGIGIEIAASSVLIDHGAEQLSERLVGHGLPKAAQSLIHELVHTTSLVYRDFRKTYRLTTMDPKKLKVHITVNFKVVNNGIVSETYAPEFAEEGMYSPEVQSLAFGEMDLGASVLTRTITSSGVVCVAPKGNGARIVPSEATAAIETLSKEQLCPVRWVYTVEMPNYYSDVTAFSRVTISPTLEVVENTRWI